MGSVMNRDLGEAVIGTRRGAACARAGGARLWSLAVASALILAFPKLALGAGAAPGGGSSPAPTANAPRTARPEQKKTWFQRHFTRPTWEEVVSECASPQDVCRMVERYIRYRSEEADRWAEARTTWARGRGDCEDFAVCVQQLCHELGLRVSVHLYFVDGRREEGHAVAVGEWHGRTWMSDLGSYEEVRSMDDVRERVSRVLSCEAGDLWGASLTRENVQRRLSRSSAHAVATGPAGSAPGTR